MEGFPPEMRIFMPFDPAMNPFQFLMIEMNPLKGLIFLYFDQEPNEEELGEGFETFISIF